jgi:hypothetical protein
MLLLPQRLSNNGDAAFVIPYLIPKGLLPCTPLKNMSIKRLSSTMRSMACVPTAANFSIVEHDFARTFDIRKIVFSALELRFRPCQPTSLPH